MICNMGIYPTVITPYNADGSIDFKRVESYLEWYNSNGCAGAFSICQSSEIMYLSVEERCQLNKTIYNKVQAINAVSDNKMTVVSSGHVADSIDDQIYELNKVCESGTDVLVLITNRLDPNNEGDEVFIKNAETIISKIPENIKLGLYECPLPYKRLVTPKILKWCLSLERFEFMKDTSCNIDIMSERLEILKGSNFKLYNANCQTFLDSLKKGAAGYCGIMCNYHPKLYSWLYHNFKKQPQKAEIIQSMLGTAGFTEVGLPYPLTAKYHMCLENMRTLNLARNRSSEELTAYSMDCMVQMRNLSKYFEEHVID